MLLTKEQTKVAQLIAKKLTETKVARVKSALAQRVSQKVLPNSMPPRSPGSMVPSNPINMEGNPNYWNTAWPRYNQPPPAFLEAQAPESFFGDVKNMGRGLFRTGMGFGAAATIGQHGSPSWLMQAPDAIAKGFAGARQGWQSSPSGAPIFDAARGFARGMINSRAVQGPWSRFMDNSYQDRADVSAPFRYLTGGAHNISRGLKNWWNAPSY